MRLRSLSLLVLGGGLVAAPGSLAAGPPQSDSGDLAPLVRAKGAVKALATTLKKRLGEALKADGLAGGVGACKLVAQDLTVAVGEERGLRLGRSSLRLRNPRNLGPAWVRQKLLAWGEGKARDVEAGHEAVEVDGEAVMRFWKPIPVQGVCLNCHASPGALGDEVRVALAEGYPEDQATGYAFGDLRGAFWVEVPLD